jgi:hypothetical protein
VSKAAAIRSPNVVFRLAIALACESGRRPRLLALRFALSTMPPFCFGSMQPPGR